MLAEHRDKPSMLFDLLDAVKTAAACDSLFTMSFQEQIKFVKEHPGAHLVIGDFEIKCLKPDKYNL